MKNLNDIQIRSEFQSGDIGYLTYLHGVLYNKEFRHGLAFESLVAGGLHEFYSSYNSQNERIWIAEHDGKMVGSIFLKNRGDSAQLRYYLIIPEYRGLGLGNKLMQLFMDFVKACGYKKVYLLTTSELVKAAHLYKKFGFALSEEKISTEFGRELIEQRYDMEL